MQIAWKMIKCIWIFANWSSKSVWVTQEVRISQLKLWDPDCCMSGQQKLFSKMQWKRGRSCLSYGSPQFIFLNHLWQLLICVSLFWLEKHLLQLLEVEVYIMINLRVFEYLWTESLPLETIMLTSGVFLIIQMTVCKRNNKTIVDPTKMLVNTLKKTIADMKYSFCRRWGS